MLGAITGDIVGSRFEWNNIKSKEFELFTKKCEFTDDTVMTAAEASVHRDIRGYGSVTRIVNSGLLKHR